MIIVNQNLPIKEWPLKHDGDGKFFGYIVAIGLFPMEWGSVSGLLPYADFAYGDDYERYLLPGNKKLLTRLSAMMLNDIESFSETGSTYNKVWIRRHKNGYTVELP